MDAAAKFRKYAADCNRMAKVSDDPETQGLWERAKLAKEEEQSVAQTRPQRASRHRWDREWHLDDVQRSLSD